MTREAREAAMAAWRAFGLPDADIERLVHINAAAFADTITLLRRLGQNVTEHSSHPRVENKVDGVIEPCECETCRLARDFAAWEKRQEET